jgi:plastocyanin
VLTGTPAVQVTPSPAGTGTPATATVPAGGGSVVSISASNILFDKNELEAKAGAITVQFDNKDSGIPHNFSVYKSKDDLTNPIAATEIATGPVMLTLQLNLEKGEYYFDCQVHPTTMNGTLKVE